MSKAKTIGFVLIGLFLFSGSMMFLFDFESSEVAEASPTDFIKIKDGYISYLDVKGYNFQFACEINQILILESEVQLQEGQIIVTSNNSFGITELIFNETVNGDVKFTINHQGNFQRDYWFRMHIFNRGLTHLPERNLLSWDTGNFDYSDMIDESFWIDQNEAGDYWLSMRFLGQVDFFIDPILSSEIILDQTTIFEENNMSVFEGTNLFADYHLDGNTLDYSGNGFNGGSFTGSYVTGFNGSAIDTEAFPSPRTFDIADRDEFTFSDGENDTSFAIDLWVNITDSSSHTIMVKGVQSGAEWEYAMGVHATEYVYFDLADGDGNTLRVRTNASLVDTVGWNHLVFVYDFQANATHSYGNNSNMHIYINGTDYTNHSFDLNNVYEGMNNTAQVVQIGGDFDAGFGEDIRIDQLRFWNDSMTSAQVTDLFNEAPDIPSSLGDADIYTIYNNSLTGNWTGFLVNGSSSAYYNLNYTITDSISELTGVLSEHKHFFYFPHNYTFVNCTFGNGTTKSVESGFDISVYNSTHDRMNFTDTSQITGNWSWFFLTENAIKNFILNPQWDVNGTLNNVSSVAYNVRVANGSLGVIGVDVLIKVIDLSETVLFSTTQSTGSNGWLNSSVSSTQFPHAENNTYYVIATCTNSTFLGYMVNYFLAFNDWDAPVVTNIVYEDTLIESVSFVLEVYVNDDYTELADLTVTMDYSFVSSGTLTESSVLTQSANFYTVSLVGQDAGTSVWFQITVRDNMSNSFESMVYQSDWIIEEEAVPAGGDGDGDGDTPAAVTPAGGIPDVVLILLFGAGAVSVAVIGYAVLQRVQVRTRTVETREVLTGLGTFGTSGEKIKVTGKKPKKKQVKKKK